MVQGRFFPLCSDCRRARPKIRRNLSDRISAFRTANMVGYCRLPSLIRLQGKSFPSISSISVASHKHRNLPNTLTIGPMRTMNRMWARNGPELEIPFRRDRTIEIRPTDLRWLNKPVMLVYHNSNISFRYWRNPSNSLSPHSPCTGNASLCSTFQTRQRTADEHVDRAVRQEANCIPGPP